MIGLIMESDDAARSELSANALRVLAFEDICELIAVAPNCVQDASLDVERFRSSLDDQRR